MVINSLYRKVFRTTPVSLSLRSRDPLGDTGRMALPSAARSDGWQVIMIVSAVHVEVAFNGTDNDGNHSSKRRMRGSSESDG